MATIRTTDGAVDAGFLLGDSAVLVRLHEGPLLVIRRADNTQMRVGRHGSGPGEFRQLVWSQPGPGATIMAYDHANRRVTFFSGTGEVLKTQALPAVARTPIPLGLFQDGTMLILSDMLPTSGRGPRGVVTDSSSLLFLSKDWEIHGPTLRVPMRTIFRAGDERSRTIGVPLGPRTEIAVTQSGFYMGWSGSPEIGFYGTTGTLQVQLTHSGSPVPVPPEAAAQLRTAGMNRRGSLGLDFTELYRDTPIPATYPRFGSLVADHSGRLWVQGFPLDDARPVVWTLYGLHGVRLRSVTLPPGSRLLDASDTELLVLAELADGDEVLQIVRVEQTPKESR